MPIDSDDLTRKIGAVVEALAKELEAIELEADQKRQAAIARSGLSTELVETALGSSSLTSTNNMTHIRDMSQALSTKIFQQPVGKPLRSKGPVAKHARRVGLTMTKLAERVGVDHWNLRNWDKRGNVPEEIEKRLAALRPEPKSPKRAK